MEQTRRRYAIPRAHVELFRTLVAELLSWEKRGWSAEVRALSRSVFVVRATAVGHGALGEAMARVASVSV